METKNIKIGVVINGNEGSVVATVSANEVFIDYFE